MKCAATKCKGSVKREATKIQKLAENIGRRVEEKLARLDALHEARAERARARARALELELQEPGGEADRRTIQRKLDSLRSGLRKRLAALAMAHKAARKALPRQMECCTLNRRKATVMIANLCGASCHLGLPGGIGGAESLVTLQVGRGSLRTMPARFVLVSAASLIPSHNSQTFDARPDYPDDVQERRYDADPLERGKVVDIGQNMQPGLIANTNVGAVDGTPVVVNGSGVVLGGNGRTMGMQRHYHSGRRDLAEYLAQHAAQFGLTAQAVRTIRDPVVVRVIDAPRAEWARLVRDLNVGLTQVMDATTEAVAQGRHFPPDLLRTLAAGLGDRELGEYLRSAGSRSIVGALERSGFITRANRGRYLTEEGLLSADARAAFERQVVGALLPDAALLERLGPGLRNTIGRSAPFFLGAAARGPDWNIAGPLRAALKDLVELRSSGQCLAQWDQQVSLVPKATIPDSVGRGLLETLDLLGDKPVVFLRFARAYFEASAGGDMFSESDPVRALEVAASAQGATAAAANSRRRCRSR